jgi:hypothetical protein
MGRVVLKGRKRRMEIVTGAGSTFFPGSSQGDGLLLPGNGFVVPVGFPVKRRQVSSQLRLLSGKESIQIPGVFSKQLGSSNLPMGWDYQTGIRSGLQFLRPGGQSLGPAPNRASRIQEGKRGLNPVATEKESPFG